MENKENIKQTSNYTLLHEQLMKAVSSKDEKMISLIFSSLDSELKKERDITSVRTEREKIMWDDPITHLRKVEEEERLDKQNELNDLMKLYVIAKSAGFNEGQELILDKLGDTDLVKEMPNASVGPRKSV